MEMGKTMLLATLCVALVVKAQTHISGDMKRVRPVEFEMRVGATRPLGSIYGTRKEFGPALGMEARYNFKNSPLDVGLAIDLTTAVYGWKPDEYDRRQSNRSAFIGFIADCNFRQGDKANPFVGIGVGLGAHDALLDVISDMNDADTTAMITSRAGFELWRHLRFTLAANLSCWYYNNVSITVGYVIGGGKKKE